MSTCAVSFAAIVALLALCSLAGPVAASPTTSLPEYEVAALRDIYKTTDGPNVRSKAVRQQCDKL